MEIIALIHILGIFIYGYINYKLDKKPFEDYSIKNQLFIGLILILWPVLAIIQVIDWLAHKLSEYENNF